MILEVWHYILIGFVAGVTTTIAALFLYCFIDYERPQL